ncbi:MAG: o-succinylbenzoate synthase [Planctomycetota bacterium]|nr:MAG: o-succinylbenzoate synthase [Planctomycetota bacterium]
MRIDRIDVYHLSVPLRKPIPREPVPFVENFPPLERLETVVVAAHSGDAVGWGETAPGDLPMHSHEWAAGVFAVLRDILAPRVLGVELESADDLHKLVEFIKGHRYAKAALDFAWWDLRARKQEKPLYELLKAKRTRIPVGETFDRFEPVDDFLAALHQAVERGAGRLGLKIRPGWDTSMLNVVRSELPGVDLHGDVEGALRLDHMEILCRMDDFQLRFLEQPLPPEDLVGHAMVQETIATPVCLDESITTPETADMALELHSGRFLNVNPGRLGGLTPASAVHDAAHEECTPCYAGANLQSPIGLRTIYALAGKENFCYPADFYPLDELLPDDLAPPLTVEKNEDGRLEVVLEQASGIGICPDLAAIEKYAIQSVTIGG